MERQLKKKAFGIKTVILVAVASIIAGVAVTMSLDLTSPIAAGDLWREADNRNTAIAGPKVVKNGFVVLARKLTPAVVNVSTTQKVRERSRQPFPLPEFKSPFFDDFFGDDLDKFFNGAPREFKRQSMGSGFVINKSGYIITNFHVIEDATEVIVTFSEGRVEYKAEVIGRDQKLDLALIKIKADGDLPTVMLGDSDGLEIGEWVMAIGNPFGLGGTVTAGIVSQKGRVIGAGPYDNFIQTDASINPGNSGGPLFNMRGEVVGINTAIVAGGQGIGFAIPINMVKNVLGQLKKHGRVTRGWIGVSIQSLTPELARSFGLKEPSGALVSSVNRGEPAEAGGLKAGDIIVSFDGKKISVLNDLPRTVAATTPGKSVQVVVIRDDKRKTLTVKVGTKREEGEIIEAKGPEGKGAGRVGLRVETVTSEMASRLGLDNTAGVIISQVAPDSPAEEAGLKRGDVIREINRRPVAGVKDYKRAVSSAKGAELLFLIQRRGSTIYVVVKPGK